MKVSTLQEGFLKEVGLTLRVYDGRSFANPTQTLAQERKKGQRQSTLRCQEHKGRQSRRQIRGRVWSQGSSGWLRRQLPLQNHSYTQRRSRKRQKNTCSQSYSESCRGAPLDVYGGRRTLVTHRATLDRGSC